MTILLYNTKVEIAMGRYSTCRVCKKRFYDDAKNTNVYCPECRDLFSGYIEYIKLNNIQRLTNCIICGQSLIYKRTKHICSSRKCKLAWQSFRQEYARRKKRGDFVQPFELPVYTMSADEKWRVKEDDILAAKWLGIETPEEYIQRSLRTRRIDDLALRARKIGMSYGEYMWRSGANAVFIVDSEHPECDEGDKEEMRRMQWGKFSGCE